MHVYILQWKYQQDNLVCQNKLNFYVDIDYCNSRTPNPPIQYYLLGKQITGMSPIPHYSTQEIYFTHHTYIKLLPFQIPFRIKNVTEI